MTRDRRALVPAPERAVSPRALPPSFPGWAREMAELYFSGTTCLFIVHGNVHDLYPASAGGGDGGTPERYSDLDDFLTTELFGSWDAVLVHDLASGIRVHAADDGERLKEMSSRLLPRLGEPSGWPRDPDKLLVWLDRFIERCLLDREPPPPKSVAFVFQYAQYLVPAGDIESLARGQGTALVRFLSWAQNPYLKRVNMAFILVADRLSEVNERLVRNPHVASIEIPMPPAGERERFCRWFAAADRGEPHRAAGSARGLAPEQLASISSGLSLVDLQVLLAQARQPGNEVTAASLRPLKKTLIERQCRGLLEFVEPEHTLDLVVGLEAAKRRLRTDAELVLGGHLDAAPMGYLICGAVGTGKTFLAECYAGTMGIPCVKLRNFRSKYVGETEGNLEQVLTVLRSLGPVVVIVDEADAALGQRQTEGDSGTSSRVFSMIASQMGDTRYRGKMIWMLLTCRPDLLPIDLKRQGRAEIHIPLFHPGSAREVEAMLLAMATKNKVPLRSEELPPLGADRRLSGADIESVLLAARRSALAAGEAAVDRVRLEAAWKAFIPSAQGLEKELQELAAVLECTEVEFLPPEWQKRAADAEGRARIQERLAAIRQLMEM